MDIARASIKRFRVVLFVCVIIALSGVIAYFEIGKLEDPNFTIKTAVISAIYPGSDAYEVEQEVTSRIEDAIQAMGEIKHIRSRSMPGVAVIYVDIEDTYRSAQLPQIWDELRQKINDAQGNMPTGCTISINNDYGDVFGQYYALVGDGYSIKEIYDYADFLKKNLVLVPGVARVDISGEQTEGIYIEFSAARLNALGLSLENVFSVLNQQNTLSEMGSTTLGSRYIRISPTSAILNVEDIGELVIGGSGGKLTRLREIATIRRDYIDPQDFKMKFNERPAIGIGIATVEGGNVVTMGEAVTKKLQELETFRPVGIELNPIYMQSDQVIKSTNDFLVNLAESLAIVVGVLLIFMGIRSGLIIGIVLLLTIAATLAIMNYTGIFLQCVSLSALIIALGSLVDNAIVVTEGMLVGTQSGLTLEDAASDSIEGSKWAMLGGTIIAILAFAPIGLSDQSVGEFCRSLFQVVGISMILSWFAALIITPVLGKVMMKVEKQKGDPYDKLLYKIYRWLLELCLHHKILTVIITIGAFIGAIILFSNIKSTFFPDSESVYYTVDVYSPEGTSINHQEKVTQELAEYIRKFPEVKNISQFIGGGGLRFMLTYSPPNSNTSFSQLIVELKDNKLTPEIAKATQKYIDEHPELSGICKLLARGATSDEKIGIRFYGDDPIILRSLAAQAMEIMQEDHASAFVRCDWREPVEVIKPKILKDQMQSLGLNRTLINSAIQTSTTGYTVGAFRDGDKSLQIKAAFTRSERNRMDILNTLPIWAPASNKSVPLGTVFGDLNVNFDDNIIIRRDRSRMITAQSEVKIGENADDMISRISPKIEKINLPLGYKLEWGGEKETSAEAVGGMSGMFLPALIVMFIIMVFLFNAFRQPVIIFMSLPLIMIGIAPGLYVANMTFSFMAIIGLLSLVGMLAKNSIVLLDQVSADFEAGRDKYEAIVEDGVSRLRPVAMSALTTVLGMIPLIWDSMFGPMAVTIMAGLTMSTILTLIVVPVLTAIAYKVEIPDEDDDDDE